MLRVILTHDAESNRCISLSKPHNVIQKVARYSKVPHVCAAELPGMKFTSWLDPGNTTRQKCVQGSHQLRNTLLYHQPDRLHRLGISLIPIFDPHYSGNGKGRPQIKGYTRGIWPPLTRERRLSGIAGPQDLRDSKVGMRTYLATKHINPASRGIIWTKTKYL